MLLAAIVLPAAHAQTSASVRQLPDAPDGRVRGGVIHGIVKVGNAAQRGVTVTATHVVTGTRFTTVTDESGAYSIALPQNGPYLVDGEYEDFSPVLKGVTVSDAAREQEVNFVFGAAGQPENTVRARNLSSLWPLPQLPPLSGSGFNYTVQLETSGSLGTASVQVPSFYGDPQFSSDSFGINGQAGDGSPYIEMSGLMEDYFEDGPDIDDDPIQEQSSSLGGAMNGGYFGELAAFRTPTPSQFHGMMSWNGGNSVLNAKPFVLTGQPSPNPNYNSNNYGIALSGRPFVPGLTRPSRRDFFLVTYAQLSASSLVNDYGVVPTGPEREGNFSGLTGPTGALVPVYPPLASTPYPDNTINTPLDTVALNLLRFLPEPNLPPGKGLNYRLLTTQGTHQIALGARYQHSFGGSTGLPSVLGENAGHAPGSIRNLNVSFVLNRQTMDVVNLFPQLGGKQQTQGYSLTAGYIFGGGNRITSLSMTSNRNNFEIRNFFTNKEDMATKEGFTGFPEGAPVNANPFNYGLPNLVFSGFSEFAQTQPASILTQTFNLSATSAWLHGAHEIRFGGDVHRIELNLLGGSNATGTLVFTGKYSQAPGKSSNQVAPSGSSFADYLVGLPQQITIESLGQRAYTRQTGWQAFVRDDWRALPSLTLLAGLHYVYFSPFAEKYDRLSTLDYVPGTVPLAVQPYGTGLNSGAQYPRTLIEPERNNFSPHAGFSWQAARNTTVRAGYGVHYTVGQYGSFIQYLTNQPPFANVLNFNNLVLPGTINNAPVYFNLFSTADAFAEQSGDGNYAVNRHYRVPYIQIWTAEVEQSLPGQIVLDVAYTGAKGTRLDAITAPGPLNVESLSSLFFDFEDSTAYSNFNGAALTATKLLENGLALQATYTYSHAIDNASSFNAGTPVVAQNADNLQAEEGNSSFDIRHQVYGSFLYELPFGRNMPHLNSGGWVAQLVGDWSIAGTFAAATGPPLTPNIAASAAEVERGTHGSVRPNRVPGTSITAGGGHLAHWFNTGAFSTDFAPNQFYGTASRNSIPGPGVVNVGLSLSKVLLFNETKSLELRGTASNAFNNVQYAVVNTQFDSPTVGQVTGTQPMRQITFLGRFRF